MKGVFFRGDNVLNKPIIIEIDKPIDIPIHSVQFDKNSRFIDVYLLNNSIPLDVTKCTVTVAGVKSDGQEFFNECDKINPEEGLVRFEITEQMNVSPGIVNCEIKVYSDSAGVLTTKPFSIKVTRSLLKSDIESTGEFRALTEAISKVQGFDNKLVDLRNDTNEKFAQTNAQLSDANIKIDSQCVYLMMYTHLVSDNDWTAAIEKAIEDTTISPSRKLFIHSGTFEVSREIKLPNVPISIVGINRATTVIRAMAECNNIFYKDSELVIGTKFENLCFDCNYKTNFMYIDRLKEFEMVDCFVYRFKEYAIDINYTGTAPGAINYGYKIKNNQFRGCFDGEPRMVVPKYCVRLRGGCSDNVFDGNTFVNVSDCFIEDYSGGNDRITNNHFFSYPAPTYCPEAFIKSSQAIIIDNNYFDSPTLGILHQGDDFAIRNNFFYWSRADFGSYSAKGIKITKNASHNCRNFIISNNKFDHGDNVTLVNDVEIDDYYTQYAHITGNVSDAQKQINNYYEKKIFDRNNRELLFQIFSNGGVYLTRRELNGGNKNVIQLEDDAIKFQNGNTTVQIKNGYITINDYPVTPLVKGSGSPMNKVAPIQQGQLYLDTTANAFYISYGTSNTQWIKITQ